MLLMTIHEYKKNIRNAIINRDCYCVPVGDSELKTRCPFCGDSSNPNTGHFYIKINPNDEDGICYNCFKCPAGGYMTDEVLEMLGVDTKSLEGQLKYVQSKGSKGKDISVNKSVGNWLIPDIVTSYKTDYICNRLGINFTEEDFKKMRCIPSFKDFCHLNKFKVHDLTCKTYMAVALEKNYVGFLSSDRNSIFFRDVTEKQNLRWIKYKITEKKLPRSTFTLESQVDIFTKDVITVNFSEGVFDAIGIAYHFDFNKMNCINRAVGSKNYGSAIKSLIDMGIVGSNVVLNIFADNDGTYDTSYEFYKKRLSVYRHIFGRINVIYNVKGKDYGVPKDQIDLQIRKVPTWNSK